MLLVLILAGCASVPPPDFDAVRISVQVNGLGDTSYVVEKYLGSYIGWLDQGRYTHIRRAINKASFIKRKIYESKQTTIKVMPQ